MVVSRAMVTGMRRLVVGAVMLTTALLSTVLSVTPAAADPGFCGLA
jgi:hypothetical protein